MPISNEALDATLAASPSPNRVTASDMEERIKSIVYHRLTDTLTMCVIRLDNGFTVTGESACADPANYNKEVGEKIAYENAFNKLWPLFGFLLKEKMHLASQA